MGLIGDAAHSPQSRPPTDGLVLAVDGGGSKTDAVAIDLTGSVVSHVRGPASNPQLLGWEETLERLNSLRHQIVEETGTDAFISTHLYLAGLDLPQELSAGRIALAEWMPDVLDNDVFALLRSGTAADTAVAVVCGTGVNAVGVRADGDPIRYAALGPLTGDWGGGDGIGRAAVWHASRAHDGRGSQTSLVQSIPRRFGFDDYAEFIEAVHFASVGREAYSQLAPVVFADSDHGDAVAQSVVDRQAEELALLAATTIRRLDAMSSVVPTIFGGGVITAGNPRLIEGIRHRLHVSAPGAEVVIVDVPPITGAGVAALLGVGAAPSAIDRYRSLIAGRSWTPAGA